MNRMIIKNSVWAKGKDDNKETIQGIYSCRLCDQDLILTGVIDAQEFNSVDDAMRAGWSFLTGGCDGGWICPSCMAFMNSTP